MNPGTALEQLVIQLSWTQVWVGVLLLAGIQFLIAIWIKARLESSINHEYGRKLEEFRYEIKVREQAARVAEYMEIARHLREESPEIDYQTANRLAWELAMWLPSNVYKQMAESLVNPNEQNNVLEVVIAVRKLLLGKNAGDLVAGNILSHAPRIGSNRPRQEDEPD